ncbi:MAG: AAA family ATPase [Saprospiraceae bacterium]|nr:AAA family ATPase [Saprospiraceae bacterium]
MEFDELNQLRAAIQSSPDNLPLRKYLASLLIKKERWEEAELELKEALKLAPNDLVLQIGLANAFHAQEKTGSGLVLIEELTQKGTPPPGAWLIYAKLLLQSGQAKDAKEAYENAVALDPNLKDSFLESDINLKANQNPNPEPEKIKLFSGKSDDQEKDNESSVEIERPNINFDDVGGMTEVKEEIRMKIIHPLQHPDLYKAYGKKIGGGILLYGPPGCGKTHLARATAGQVNSNFIPVGISDILDMYIGQSERNLHAIFQKARNLKPCVLFFDEVDALGASRTDMRNSNSRRLINQFLDELDGVRYDNDGVLVLAATNAPWHLDPAFRRPGRFDRIIFVPPPDESARGAILDLKLKGKPLGSLKLDKITKRTKDFSGADLEAIIDIAVEAKLEESIRKGTALPIETRDLEQALKKHRPTTREWFNTAKNYALFANESGLYDDILAYLNIKK